MEQMKIAIDAMGGDHGLLVTIPASIDVLGRHENLILILVGDEEKIREQLRLYGRHYQKIKDRVIIKHASQQVGMGESPSKALRGKKDSSMRVAINLVKYGEARACVSAGNTGALMATAKFVLKMLPGIDRPAIIASWPTSDEHKDVRVLDLGANVDSSADNLYQFGVMGSALTAAVDNIAKPKIGLLNIGEEEIKGNEQVKHAAKLLSENPDINYVGYIEGDAVFKGDIDIVVCDGFVGNILLKGVEGIARLVGSYLKAEYKRNWYTKIAALFSIPVLKNFKKRLDPGKRNGASLLGLQGIVIKSHGSANREAFAVAIEESIAEVRHNVPQLIGEKVGKMLEEVES